MFGPALFKTIYKPQNSFPNHTCPNGIFIDFTPQKKNSTPPDKNFTKIPKKAKNALKQPSKAVIVDFMERF